MLQTFPVLALHMLFSWYEAAQFRALSWLQLRGMSGAETAGGAPPAYGIVHQGTYGVRVPCRWAWLYVSLLSLSHMNFHLFPLHWLLAE